MDLRCIKSLSSPTLKGGTSWNFDGYTAKCTFMPLSTRWNIDSLIVYRTGHMPIKFIIIITDKLFILIKLLIRKIKYNYYPLFLINKLNE